jgi:hypothetical protein
MNLAWGGIVLIVLLVPGFLFFVGFYLPERFTRQLAERSTLGHLAGTLLVSLVIHTSLYSVNSWTCDTRCIRIDVLLEFVTLSQPDPLQLARLAPRVADYLPEITLYTGLAGGLGVLLGAFSGGMVVVGPLRRLAQHTWVYGLLIEDQDGASRMMQRAGDRFQVLQRAPWIGHRFKGTAFREVTLAYVLTRTSFEGRVLLYRGFLKAFGIRSDGTFTYLVLVQPHRMYMRLSEGAAATTSHDAVHQISANHLSARDGNAPSFFIDGSQIANVFFDREQIPNRGTTAHFEAVVAEQRIAIESAEAATPASRSSPSRERTLDGN